MTQAEFSSLFKKSLKSLQVTRRTALNMLLGQSHHMKEDLFFGHSQVAQHIRGVGGKLGVLCDHELWGQIVTMWDSTDVSLRWDKATPTVGHKTIQRHSPHQPWWPQLRCVWPQTLRFLQGKFHDQKAMEGSTFKDAVEWIWMETWRIVIYFSELHLQALQPVVGSAKEGFVPHPPFPHPRLKSTHSPGAVPASEGFRKLKAQQRK